LRISELRSPQWHGRGGLARAITTIASITLLFTTGCAVTQPSGAGKLQRVVEPTTKRGYWLYLPKDYVEAAPSDRKMRRWPLVCTFHGMKPFDNAKPQALEWESEADRYGFLVIAPELRAPDVFAQFPLRTVHPGLQSDELATLAIIEHVFQTTDVDRSNVLATSWSSGGYMAHFMLNRHPERFTCLAVRQSNFSHYVLDSQGAARSTTHPVLILNTENDFAICRKESAEAVKWYQDRGYKNVYWAVIRSLGHERTPDLAADFFGRVAGVAPSRPPQVLAQRQAIDGNAEGLALLAGQMRLASTQRLAQNDAPAAPTAPVIAAPPPANAPPMALAARTNSDLYSQKSQATPPRPTPAGARPSPAPPRPVASAQPPAPRAVDFAQNEKPRSQVAIRVSSAIGFEPLHLSYSAECPIDWQRSARFFWFLNGKPISNEVNGQRTLADAGDYELRLRVLTAAGDEHWDSWTIRVLPRSTAPVSAGSGN
jgi:predicted esterase